MGLTQGYFLAIFSKLKGRKTKTQANFWPKLKHFFSKTQGNISKLKFLESLKSINSRRANIYLIQTDNQSARVQSSRQYLNNISRVGQKLKLFSIFDPFWGLIAAFITYVPQPYVLDGFGPHSSDHYVIASLPH